MSIFKWLSPFLLVFVISCKKDVPALEDFDTDVWRNDRHACSGKRAGMTESLLSQKEKLLALDEIEIVEKLGKPDQNELYKRNEKFYYYFIEPAKDCVSGSAEAKRLVIRFNAVGLAKEITID